MAAYTVVPFDTALAGTALAALQALEIKLETLDSTTNTIYYVEVIKVGQFFKGVLLYKG